MDKTSFCCSLLERSDMITLIFCIRSGRILSHMPAAFNASICSLVFLPSLLPHTHRNPNSVPEALTNDKALISRREKVLAWYMVGQIGLLPFDKVGSIVT